MDLIRSTIKKFSKKTRHYFDISRNLKDYLLMYSSWHFIHCRRLKRFYNIHKGQDCFIIGNGPSLNRMDLSNLNDFHLFGLNKIYLIFEKVPLSLTYHVAINPLVIEQSINHFTTLRCPSFLSYQSTKDKYDASYKNIFLIKTIDIDPPGFQTNLANGINEGYTVTYAAMQIAFYMGFSNVFLIGVDHNFQVNGSPNEKQHLEGEDINHFSPSYFGAKEWHLPDLEASELSYRIANFMYRRNNKAIFDCTLDGKLNIFPKISFENAISLCKRKS